MKRSPQHPLCQLPRWLLGLFLPGLSLFAAQPGQSVVSIAAAPETPVTARIAPTSSVPPDVAKLAAVQLTALVAGTEVFSVAATGSMRPAFDDNTVLLTEPAPFKNLQIGDIVVFRHRVSGLRIVHRILERRDDGYWTKGDRARRMDSELVTPENYIGRVYGIIYASRAGKQPLAEPLRKNEALLAAAP